MTSEASATAQNSEFETVIGLEVHVQLRTNSKMFCRCPAAYQDTPPNTHVCPVCQGLPGALPVINRQAVEWTIKTGLALDMPIPQRSKFDRKNYPYPDLVKGYQISQFDMPLTGLGYLDIEVGDASKRVGITRAHLEEDTARLLHRTNEAGESYSLIDLNRSGVPLMEIVSEPDMRSADEARTYLLSLRQILRYLGVSTADMEKGSFRCDANISLRPWGQEEFGAKVEVKNMNSFRAVYRALEFEEVRQTQALRAGARIVQETRGGVESEGVTASQRTKEYAAGYRDFPGPGVPPMHIARNWVAEIKATLPELPKARFARFKSEYGLGDFETGLLTQDRDKADFYESAVAELSTDALPEQAKKVANWMTGELVRIQNERGESLDDLKPTPAHFGQLIALIDAGTISSKLAKDVFESMYESGKDPTSIVAESGQTQISDADELKTIVKQVIGEQPAAVQDYRDGKDTAIKFLVGQVMRATRGRANPKTATELLQSTLDTIS